MALPLRRTEGSEAAAGWEPVAEMQSLWRRLSRLLDGSFGTWQMPSLFGTHTPLADLEDAHNAYVVTVELPGVKKGDIDVEVSRRVLRIAAERKDSASQGRNPHTRGG